MTNSRVRETASKPFCEENWIENGKSRTSLDDLPMIANAVGFGVVGRHGQLGYENKSVHVQGRTVRHALSTHAPATLIFDLDGQYHRFTTHVALNDDAVGRATSADFYVLADGKAIGCATQVLPGEDPRRIEADVTKAHTLELQVRTDHWDYCHSVWVEPTLTLSGSDKTTPSSARDCLNRAEISIPDVESESAICIATVASPGYEDWLDTFLTSLHINGNCPDARVAVFCFGASETLDRVIQIHGAVKITCRELTPINMATKSVLYSVGQIIPATKYLCFDTDMIVLGSLQGVVSALDTFPHSSVLICRDSANIPALGQALSELYQSSKEDLTRITGNSFADMLNTPLVVNDGFFAATRPAINAIHEVIQSFPGATEWVNEKQSAVPWRNQFIFNLALAKTGTAVEINQSFNWQLNHRTLEFDEITGLVRTSCQGLPLKIVHYNGNGRNKYGSLKHRFNHHPTSTTAPHNTNTHQPLRRRHDSLELLTPRFVICSSPRTGSHMLATALNQHPDLNVAGEILQRPWMFGLAENDRSPFQENSVIELAYQRFNGCIIHRHHTQAIKHICRLDYLKVIFLTRRNWIAQLASESRARQTNVWHLAPRNSNYLSDDGCTPSQLPNNAPTLSIPQCLKYLQEQTLLEVETLEHLRACPLLMLTYEELQNHWEKSITRVLDFLEIASTPLSPINY